MGVRLTKVIEIMKRADSWIMSKTDFHPVVLLSIILILCPAIIQVFFIKKFGVNVVYWDQWELLPLIDKLHAGTLTFYDLIAQHNEHRILFPRMIQLAQASLTHFNVMTEMYLSWALVVMTLALIFLMYREKSGISKIAMICFIPVAWVLFTLKQVENILWGWQFEIYLCVFGFFAMLYFLNKVKGVDINLFMAAFFATISMFSFLNGLFTWPVGLLLILMSDIKNKGRVAVSWILISILLYISFFYSWHIPQNHGSINNAGNPVVDGILYLFANIGSSILYGTMPAIIGGVIIFAAIVIAVFITWKNKAVAENKIWLSIIIFGLFTSLANAIGRSGWTLENALMSRYTTFSIIIVIGLYLLTLQLYQRASKDKLALFLLVSVVLAVLITGVYIGYTGGYAQGSDIYSQRAPLVDILKNYQFEDDQSLSQLYPVASVVKERVHVLVDNHMNVFN
jgi:hypothetical protein